MINDDLETVINEYDTLSYDQQYQYLCDVRGEKQCQLCGFWEMTLYDSICGDCQYLEDERRRTSED